MNRLKKKRNLIFLIVTFIVAAILPFIKGVGVIEIFFLSIPLALAFIITSIFLIIHLVDKREDRTKIVGLLFVPVFVLTQFLSAYTVDKVQGLRSKYFITRIEH